MLLISEYDKMLLIDAKSNYNEITCELTKSIRHKAYCEVLFQSITNKKIFSRVHALVQQSLQPLSEQALTGELQRQHLT